MTNRTVVMALFVSADECPQFPLRVLGLVAQRGLVAANFQCRKARGRLLLRLILDPMSDREAQIIANKIDQLIGVRNLRVVKARED